MAVNRDTLRDWHRLFGLLLTDFFAGSPFTVDVERDLSGQVPWQKLQAGVYDCQWGTDVVRVIVAGELPREPHNAPLHLFSASPELVGFGRGAYRQRSEKTGRLLRQLIDKYRGDAIMSFTWEDFEHWYIKDHFAQLTPEEQRETVERLPVEQRREMLKSLPAEERLADLSTEQIRQYLDQRTAGRSAEPHKARRKR